MTPLSISLNIPPQILIFNFFIANKYRIMPIHRGIDDSGSYYQWGNEKKYYYIPGDIKSEARAYQKAHNQAKAIFASGYRGK